MVGSVERISQDIAVLDEAVKQLADELHNTYSSYLAVLGPAVRQQLILASYNVCTQGYPEQFLSLPYSHRQQLQQTLRHLAHQVHEELLAQLHVPVVPEDLLDEMEMAAIEGSESDVESQSLPESGPLVAASSTSALAARSLTPIHLAEWQQDLEQAIVDELRTASHAANRLLQQAGILPKKLPEQILEAATKAEVSEVGGTTPNLLTLLVDTVGEPGPEASRSEDSKSHSVMQIVTIHLRLSDIEFSDASITAVRNRVRELSAQLKVLGREYHKKQRERAIAEAQSAWRATWTEE